MNESRRPKLSRFDAVGLVVAVVSGVSVANNQVHLLRQAVTAGRVVMLVLAVIAATIGVLGVIRFLRQH